MAALSPEMDLSNTKLSGNRESKSADISVISQLFRSGYWKITTCAWVSCLTSILDYYVLVYMTSSLASSNNRTTKNEELVTTRSGDLDSIMAWMSLADLVIVIAVAVFCYFMTAKRVFLGTFLLSVMLQIIALVVLNQRILLLVVTMLSRGLTMSGTTLVMIYASLLYPTANRCFRVGACLCVGRMGMLLEPFIFETVLSQAYFYATVFNMAVLLTGFSATVLLPSRIVLR